MLKIAGNPYFWAPVGISIPGEAKPYTIQVKFKRFDREAYADKVLEVGGLLEKPRGSDDKAGIKQDLGVLLDVMLDWKDCDGEFSPENLEQLLRNYPASASEIWLTWRKEQGNSKAKN